MIAQDIAARAAQLSEAWQSGKPTDAELRAECAQKLDELRALFRERPELFGAEVVATLRRLAESLRAPARALDVLRTTFGYEAFRPGQAEIISALLAGRDCVG